MCDFFASSEELDAFHEAHAELSDVTSGYSTISSSNEEALL